MKRMAILTGDFLPLRDVPFALLFTTAWLLVLIVTDYQVSEWLGVTIVAYVILWTTLVVVRNAVAVALQAVHRLAMRIVRDRYGFVLESTPHGLKLTGNPRAITAYFAALLISVGLASIFTLRIVSYLGFPPMLAVVNVAAFTIAGVGAAVLIVCCAISFSGNVHVARRELQMRRYIEDEQTQALEFLSEFLKSVQYDGFETSSVVPSGTESQVLAKSPIKYDALRPGGEDLQILPTGRGTGLQVLERQCPKCRVSLVSHWDQSRCLQCGHVDYYSHPPPERAGRSNLMSAATRYVFRYVGDLPSLAEKLIYVKLRRQQNQVTFEVSCPFCDEEMEQFSRSGGEKVIREETYRCRSGHQVSLVPRKDGSMGWK